MLQRLGRWLRAAGYDTQIATDAKADYHLLNQAITEHRLLLTRDRELSQHRRAKDRVVLINSTLLDDAARELSQQVHINWLYQPFTRCLVCNTPLLDATAEQQASLPQKSRQYTDKAYYCPTCRQVFWDGSHVKRMRRHLEQWQQYCQENCANG